jgi:hypothetical protein
MAETDQPLRGGSNLKAKNKTIDWVDQLKLNLIDISRRKLPEKST